MAASRNPSREFGDKRNQQNYYDRNRTFSSTTTDHFRNKLSQIGIEKDLRELLERKRLQKDQDKNFPDTSNTCSIHNVQKTERKVRFEAETSLRRSKSFTSESTKSQEINYQRQKPSYNRFLKEHNLELPQNVHRNNRIKKTDFVDLHHPINIKIEIRTDTGARKYTVDSSVPIPDIKCDLKKSRTVLKHTEPKEKSPHQQENESGRKHENRGSAHVRGKYHRPYNNKNKENKKHSSLPNNEEQSDLAVEDVVESLTNIAIKDESEK